MLTHAEIESTQTQLRMVKKNLFLNYELAVSFVYNELLSIWMYSFLCGSFQWKRYTWYSIRICLKGKQLSWFPGGGGLLYKERICFSGTNSFSLPTNVRENCFPCVAYWQKTHFFWKSRLPCIAFTPADFIWAASRENLSLRILRPVMMKKTPSADNKIGT